MTTRVRIWRNSRTTLPPWAWTAASKPRWSALALRRTRIGTRGPLGAAGAAALAEVLPAAAFLAAWAAARALGPGVGWAAGAASAAAAGAACAVAAWADCAVAAAALGSMRLGTSPFRTSVRMVTADQTRLSRPRCR